MIRILSSLALILGLSQAQAAQSFSFFMRGFPNRPDGCKSVSPEVQRMFEGATQNKVLVVNCSPDLGGHGLNLEVRYVADKVAPIVSNAAWPMYRTYADCLKALSAEEAYFTKTTGLTPFSRYCAYHSEKSSWEKSFIFLYTPMFHATGTPKAVLRSLSLNMFEGGYYGGPVTEQEIVAKSRAAGIPIVTAHIDAPAATKTYDSDLWLRFVVPPEKAGHQFNDDYILSNSLELFSPDPLDAENNPMRGDSLAQCEAQKKDAEQLKLSGSVVWFCMWDYMLFQSRLYVLRIKPGFERYQRFLPGDDGEPLLNQYASHDDCRADLAAMTSHYQGLYGKLFVGALCSWKTLNKPNAPIRMSIYVRQE